MMNEFIDQLDLPVDKIFNYGIKQKIAAQEDDGKRNDRDLPVLHGPDTKTDQHRQEQGCEGRKFARGKIFSLKHGQSL
jgi:hypothetical protein